MKFDAFGTSKHGEGKSLSKNFFATLISTLGRFNRANKKNSVIYTLRIKLYKRTILMQDFILQPPKKDSKQTSSKPKDKPSSGGGKAKKKV